MVLKFDPEVWLSKWVQSWEGLLLVVVIGVCNGAIVVDTCGLCDYYIDWDSTQCLTYTASTIFNDWIWKAGPLN